MNTLTRKLATAGSALALAASGLLLASSPASAATSCYGSDCTGKDPSTTVCQNDARTVATTGLGVELRYSPTCRAAWARTGADTAMTIWVESNTGLSQSAYHSGNDTVWTAMIDDKGIIARSCGYVMGFGQQCSSWY
ncbi:DUF2690 domain-containing protein [Streptomyces sp. SR27]|uniref:DUF2690 domain-containing protein n=1 Tax=Streptomyces sp. SR27 TaxID=3076630 RepID=UPI00295BE1A1|nr:DUF2690 domain-containing protein [Streptomyces sp. SR27]MDV9193477.1 DUF2690 domain-containing protein [Streptomyces sp. SR27]